MCITYLVIPVVKQIELYMLCADNIFVSDLPVIPAVKQTEPYMLYADKVLNHPV